MGEITIFGSTTKYPLQKIGYMAGVCWNSPIDNIEKNIVRAKDCINSGHGRVLEFVDVEMELNGYSARTIREYYTHIGGSPTRLQSSTRYIDCSDVDLVCFSKNPEALDIQKNVITFISEQYKKLKEIGVPREDCAMILPLGMPTKIVDKRNLRNLVEMSHQRKCSRAYWEFRKLFSDIEKALSGLSDEWEWIVKNLLKPKCEYLGYCPEKKSCGRKIIGDRK